ncbi:hypothetical protein [Salinicoccus halodurans]|uniref:Uncharacterized protein n=1 Tax=Salinicoccus halodurans TaxID=407035 RepID=A0A0F7HJN6_9STAP|nr:hypothetical protein [Salinicoccus halodurans]AKG73616.1 hypothetical protein AAT16_04950 [Salinicoccus halodurans]SFK53435.1 hypothetical protein SAMN05216235_0227 [Salinicoccus halodurans]
MQFSYDKNLEYKILYNVKHEVFDYPNTSMPEYDIRTVDFHMQLMEKKGLIVLTPFTYDFYYSNIELTDEGEALLAHKAS